MSGVAAAVVVLVAAACGDAVESGPFVDGEDGGATEAGPDVVAQEAAADSSPPVKDAGSEEAEALPPGACGAEKGPTSTNCQIARRCSSGECAAESIFVQCLASGGGTRPPIDGCAHLGTNDAGAGEEWCCPPTACVRRVFNDSSCMVGEKFFWCPTFDSGASVAPPACRRIGVGVEYDGYCCP